MHNYLARTALLIIFLFMIVDCRPFTRTKLLSDATFEESMMDVRTIGIIADACAEPLLGRFGKRDRISVPESRRTGKYVTKGISAYLATKGYEITYQFSPFICSTLDRTKKYKLILQRHGDEVKNKKATEPDSSQAVFQAVKQEFAEIEGQWPFDVDASLAADEEYRKAIEKLQYQAFLSIGIARDSGKITGSLGDLMEAELKAVQERAKSDALLFVFQKGYYAHDSSGRMREQITIGLISGGACIGSSGPAPEVHTMVLLVDAKTGKLLWVNELIHVNSAFMEKKYYHFRGGWASNLFADFPISLDINCPDYCSDRLGK